jgi:hypothetical protein
MKLVNCAVAMAAAATALGQSTYFEFGERPVRHEVAYSGIVPFTGFTGIAIIRTQADMDGLWAKLQGAGVGIKPVSPLRLNSADEQFIVIVIPAGLAAPSLPSVAALVEVGRENWHMEIVPNQTFRSPGPARIAQALVVRTPRGPDNLDVWIRTQGGSILASLRQANPHGKTGQRNQG